MLVLVSFGLVLLATILLVVGLLNDDGLTLIYLSIAASATAAVVLYVAFRRARPKKDADAATAPAPLSEDIAPTPIDETTAVAAVVAPEAPPVAAPEPDPAPVAAVESSDDEWMADADWEDDEVVDFPIADYDELTVGEIMPLLPQLYSDELDDVITREQAGKNRSTIIARLEELKEIGTDADAAEQAAASEVDAAPAPAPAPTPAPAPAAELVEDDDDDFDDGYFFPIADYDDLSVSQITPLLSQLEGDELDEVREREQSGAGRKTILTEIDRLTGGASTPAPAAKQPARSKKAAPASRAKKAPAKKTTAKKAPATKKATKAKATKKKATKKARKTAKKSAAPRFPIADYDDLTVADIRPRLTDLSDRQLRMVREREEAGAGRKTVLKDIDNRLS